MPAVCLPKPSARLAVQKASAHCIGTVTSEKSACSFAVFCSDLLIIRLVSGAPCAASFPNLWASRGAGGRCRHNPVFAPLDQPV